MKRIGKLWTDLIRALLLCLVLVLGLTAGGFAAPRKTVLVHNVQEMMEALDDHTEVILAPGRYNLSTWLASTAAEQVIHRFPWNPLSPPGLYMAYEDLELAGFQDLTIRGQDTEKITAEIVTEDPYTPVLHFRNCQNFRLAHLRVGHSLQAGRCSGAVLKLDLVQDARLENLDLYGCGTYGYEALGKRYPPGQCDPQLHLWPDQCHRVQGYEDHPDPVQRHQHQSPPFRRGPVPAGTDRLYLQECPGKDQ